MLKISACIFTFANMINKCCFNCKANPTIWAHIYGFAFGRHFGFCLHYLKKWCALNTVPTVPAHSSGALHWVERVLDVRYWRKKYTQWNTQLTRSPSISCVRNNETHNSLSISCAHNETQLAIITERTLMFLVWRIPWFVHVIDILRKPRGANSLLGTVVCGLLQVI